jgi:hypothetical protein
VDSVADVIEEESEEEARGGSGASPLGVIRSESFKKAEGLKAKDNKRDIAPTLSTGRRERTVEREGRELSSSREKEEERRAPAGSPRGSKPGFLGRMFGSAKAGAEDSDAYASFLRTSGSPTQEGGAGSKLTSYKWSLGKKFDEKGELEKVRGVMKLTALDDSVILILDKGRKKKFIKR